MKKIILIGVLFFAVICLYGQNSTDPIEITKHNYLQNGQSLKPRQLSDILKTNPDAYKEFKIAKVGGTVFDVLSGLYIVSVVGYGISDNFNDYSISTWEFLAISSVAYIGLSIPFIISSTKHTKKAVTIYNNGLKYSKTTAVDYKIMLTNNGIGLKIVF